MAEGRDGGVVLCFMNEVAGGRGLLETLRERIDAGAGGAAVAAPQNQPVSGQIVNRDELRDAAKSRVEVTQDVLDRFGIEASGAIFDHDPRVAIDDAVRAFQPVEVLLSSLSDSRFGAARKDFLSWAQERFEVPITHIPVRIDDDAVALDVTHTLVVATQTVNSPDLVERLKARAKQTPHRYTIICPASGSLSREEVCARLAETLAELYRVEIDATGQPMSPEPESAVKNAIEHYRVDEILISTLAGEKSKWLEAGLIEKVEAFSPKPVVHVQSGAGSNEPVAATAGATA